jgi:WD40 repeat protein
VTFSPDGATLASASYDSTIILWDISNPASPTQLGTPLEGHSDAVQSLAFSPDGKALASGSDDGASILWDIDPESWIRRACAIAGSNLTQSEWQQYFGQEPYRKTCPQWPEGE